MSSVAQILESAFEKARKSGEKIGKATAAEAQYIGISPAHYSRIRNARVTLSSKLIDQIVEVFAAGDSEYAGKLKDELWAARGESAQKDGGFPQRPTTDKYSVENIATLFNKLSHRNSLLVVDYRDWPQAIDQGAYPHMADKASEAINAGLCFALCQPFGSAETLFEKHNKLAEAIKEKQLHDKSQARSFLSAYSYLYDLAMRVREFYEQMRKKTANGLGQIVLYEADVANPVLTASGIQSRLFYADFYEDTRPRHQTKIYEWVAVLGDEHAFVERSNLSLNIDAVKLQFNPIPAYWETCEEKNLPKRLPSGSELDKAYEEFGTESLFGEKEEIRWKDWSR